MPDVENVISHLQIIHTWAEFARERDLQFFTPKHLEDIAQWSDDALNLLKEQKAVVRCCDCKHWDSQCHSCEHFDGIMQPDFYCADGVKRDD